jgi:hypothetical protein
MVGFGQDTYPPWTPRSFIIVNSPTGIADVPEAGTVKLHMSAFPNPANGGTTLSFTLPQRESVSLTIYDVSGRLVARIEAGSREAGPHEIPWDGRSTSGAEVATGMYLCRLDAGAYLATGKVTVLR